MRVRYKHYGSYLLEILPESVIKSQEEQSFKKIEFKFHWAQEEIFFPTTEIAEYPLFHSNHPLRSQFRHLWVAHAAHTWYTKILMI